MVEDGGQSVDLDALLEEFLERMRRGEEPSTEDYARRHPGLADEIREVFSAAAAMENLKGASGDPSGTRAPTPQTLPERIGDFRIIREIGRGGMGAVHEAEQESLGRRVAVKVLLHQTLHGSAQLERFLREARLAAGLHHTNIVTVYGVGEEGGLRYIVMELIEGVSLDRVIAQMASQEAASAGKTGDPSDGQLAAVSEHLYGDGRADRWYRVACLGLQLAEALRHAHERGVLHRDIKPGNVLVDGHGGAWIADFGLARAMEDDDVSQTGTTAGTLRYMAPERFRGETTCRTDLYGLGLVLREVLTLTPAFVETDRARLIHRITQEAVRSAREANRDVPRDLDTIVGKLTAPDPRHRYPSAAALADDLRRYLDGRPVKARPLAWPMRVWCWSRRNPVVAGLTAALLLLVLATVSATTAGLVQTRKALAREQSQRQRAETNATLALAALDSMFSRFSPAKGGASSPTSVSQSGGEALALPAAPVLSIEAAGLLQDLLPLYDRLASETGDERHVREQAAAAGKRIGDVQWQLGQFARAAESYVRASEMYRDLAAKQGSTTFVLEQARIQNALGQLHRNTAKADEAEGAHRDALALIMSLPEKERTRRDARFETARTHFFIGSRAELKGPPGRRESDRGRARPDRRRRGEADEHLGEAVDLLLKLLEERPADAECRCLLALCYRQRPHDERRGDQAAARILEELVRDFPGVPDYRYELAHCYGSVSLRNSGQLPTPDVGDAEEQLRRGLEQMEWLVRRHPYVSRYAAGRAQLCHKLAMVHRRAGRLGEAEKHCRRAVDEMAMLCEQNPEVATYTIWLGAYRNALADVLMQRGELPEARELLSDTVTRLEATGEQDPLRSFAQTVSEQSRRILKKPASSGHARLLRHRE